VNQLEVVADRIQADAGGISRWADRRFGLSERLAVIARSKAPTDTSGAAVAEVATGAGSAATRSRAVLENSA